MEEEKETKDVLATLPIQLVTMLEEEAKRSHRSRNKQLAAILEERYAPLLAAEANAD